MLGRHISVNDIAGKWRNAIAGAQIWHGDRWSPLGAGQGYQQDGYGPELSFAQEYLHGPDKRPGTLGIVKVAAPEASLHHDWDPALEGGLFAQLVAQARAAMRAGPVILNGLIWLQGEVDSKTAKHAKAYKQNFAHFVRALRQALGKTDLPVVSALTEPPVDRHPFSGLVRQALKDPVVGGCASISCENLASKAGTAHYSNRGISIAGRQFAARLSAISSTAPREITQWLWDSKDYQCWFCGPDAVVDQVVVSMPYATDDDGFKTPGFGQAYFQKMRVAALFIRTRESNWFQTQEIFAITDRIHAFLGDNVRVVIYGASMGGYGAILTSRALAAEKVIAIAPQYSLDRVDVPFETRWKPQTKRIGRFCHRLEDHISSETSYYVIYDPFSVDRPQVALLPEGENWHRVKLPFASHQVLHQLLEVGLLPLVLHAVFKDGPDTELIVRKMRQARRHNRLYWLTLARKTAARRPRLALSALDQCRDVGGPPQRIKTLRAEIEARLQQSENRTIQRQMSE